MYIPSCSENLKGQRHLEDLNVDRIILNSTLKNECMRVRTGFVWHR
jgi:hypothetical protein